MLYIGKHFVFAVTGPSGSGKTTYTRMLGKAFGENVGHNITVTTRKKRNGADESEYFEFISTEDFQIRSKRGDFCCETALFGNQYAYQIKDMLKVFEADKDIIVDSIFPIQQIRSIAKNVFIVFLDCEEEEISQRIKQRSPEMSDNEYMLRIQYAKKQKQQIKYLCDYTVNTSSKRSKETIYDEIFTLFMECRNHTQ